MRRGMFGGMLAAALLAATGARAAPVEAYGRLPDVEDVGLSPDGMRLALVGVLGADRVITILKVGSNQPEMTLKAGEAKLRELRWIDDNNLLIVSSVTEGGPTMVISSTEERSSGFVYDLRTRKLTQLSPPQGTKALDQVLGRPLIRVVNGRSKVFFTAWTFSGRYGQPWLYEYDVQVQRSHPLDQGSAGHMSYMVDSTGDLVAENTSDGRKWMLRARINGAWKHFPVVDEPDTSPSIAGLDPQSHALVLFGNIEGKTGWHTLSLDTGAWSTPDMTGTMLLADNQSGLGIGLMREGEHKTYSFFDAGMQANWEKVTHAFPGEQVDFVSSSTDHKKVVVQVFGQKSGAVFMLVDLAAGRVDPIADLYHDVPPEQVAQTRSIVYPAADGLKISAYLTLPNGRPAKGLPLVVLPHDGPRERDDLQFDWMAQALASRGYAVLQPEYRGSRMGASFAQAGFGQWGRKMQTDLSDGVRSLAGQSVIDPKRVCIAGVGYGGYAALAGVSLESGVYRCAVDISGPADLKRQVQWSVDRHWNRINATLAYWNRYMDEEGAHDPSYAAISPVDHVGQINAPVLIIHGRDDSVIDFEQSQTMVKAMQAAGKPVEFLPLAGEDHWLSRSQTRQQMLTAMVRFIETNNPPDPPAAVAANR